MHALIKSALRYFLVVGLFGGCINLMYLALPIYMMIVYDRVLFSFSIATLTTMIVGVLLCLVMMGLLDYFRLMILGRMGSKLALAATPFVLRSMLADAASVRRQGYVRGLRDLELLRDAIAQGRVLALLDLPWVLLYLGILFVIHPLVGGVATAAVFLIAVFQVLLKTLEKKRYVTTDVAFEANAELVRTSLDHAELVAGMGMLAPLEARHQADVARILASRAEAEAFHARIGATIRFLHMAGLVAVFAAGVFVFFADKITTGMIFALVMVTARLLSPFERSLLDMKGIIEVIAAYRRLRHFVPLGEPREKLSLPPPTGQFAAEGVSLALAGKAVVQNISFALEPGESLGLLGPMTAGKTSLCKVLLGIWPAMAGKVRLDGAEIGQWPEEQLRAAVGYMPQEVELFPGTVAENIARLAEPDPDKVILAAQKAGVHELILQLAQGYDTRIDRSGKNLAAGQRQLISLARALYDTPRLVILDEPQTHLDESGLRIVAQVVATLKREGITTIVVTDRTNLIIAMDKLLVMREGQAVLSGPAKDVLTELAKRQQPQQAVGK